MCEFNFFLKVGMGGRAVPIDFGPAFTGSCFQGCPEALRNRIGRPVKGPSRRGCPNNVRLVGRLTK